MYVIDNSDITHEYSYTVSLRLWSCFSSGDGVFDFPSIGESKNHEVSYCFLTRDPSQFLLLF